MIAIAMIAFFIMVAAWLLAPNGKASGSVVEPALPTAAAAGVAD